MKHFSEHNIQWTDEKIERLWNYYSKNNSFKENYFTKMVGEDLLARSQNIVGNLNNKKIVDFGCGPGFLLDHLKKLRIKPKKYIGLDTSENSLNIIKRKKTDFEKKTYNLKNLQDIALEKNIDLCFLLEVVEHLDDYQLSSTMKSIFTTLKPGGILILTTPNNETLQDSESFCPECGCIYHKWQHIRSWDEKNLKQLLLRNGFFNIKIIKTTFLTKNNTLQYFIQKLRYKLSGKKLNFFVICQKKF